MLMFLATIHAACQADFSYYFDTGSRRRCYLAPERFFEGSAAAINTAAPLQPDMVSVQHNRKRLCTAAAQCHNLISNRPPHFQYNSKKFQGLPNHQRP